MKTTRLLLTLIVLLGYTSAEAQILKRLRKKAEEAAERTIERKVEEKAERETEKAFDSVFNNRNDKKILKKRKRKERRKKKKKRKNREAAEEVENNTSENTAAETLNYSSDFVAGTQTVFTEQFTNVALNDFPGTWNTNGSGSVVTFGNDNTKWLRMDPNVSFTPDGITSIPKNSTLEFDLKVDDNYFKISKGIDIVFAQLNNRDVDFNQFYSYKGKKTRNAVIITLDPITHTNYGAFAKTYVNGQKNIDKTLGHNGFNKDNRTVHISIWRQETRLRFYIDGQKIWDLPKAFSNDVNYNAFMFSTHRGKPDDAFYISNIRLAKAGEDTREKLLQSGSFSTSDIQFDSGKSTLKASSIQIIEQLVAELNEMPNAQVKIIGHTDSDGSAAANKTLSRQRAYAVKEKMIKLAVTNYNRISIEGKGESQPIADNTTASGKAKNRRVEFLIIN